MTRRTLSLFSAFAFAFMLVAPAAHAQQILPLWPHGTPEPPNTTEPETDTTKPTDGTINGHRTSRLTNVTVPTMTVYQPAADKNTHTAALVFPGGGYMRLAWTGEGVDTCDWLTSVGVTCLLVKYRVPQPPGLAGHYPADFQDLEDAQQAMRIARSHAHEWQIDSSRIGVVGFSAGANLAVLLCNHPDDPHIESTPAAKDVPGFVDEPNGGIRFSATPNARPAFAIIVYPAYLVDSPDDTALNPVYAPSKMTPPTFLIQAENDKTYRNNAPVYYLSLMAAGVPAELHMYATGGHGFGIHPPGQPEEHWTRLADAWLQRLGMLPDLRNPQGASTGNVYVPSSSGSPTPCTATNAPQPNSHPVGSNPTNASPAGDQICVPN